LFCPPPHARDMVAEDLTQRYAAVAADTRRRRVRVTEGPVVVRTEGKKSVKRKGKEMGPGAAAPSVY
jgi:hypothetical protein